MFILKDPSKYNQSTCEGKMNESNQQTLNFFSMYVQD